MYGLISFSFCMAALTLFTLTRLRQTTFCLVSFPLTIMYNSGFGRADFALLDCSISSKVASVYSRAMEEHGTLTRFERIVDGRLCTCQALPQSGNTLHTESAECSNSLIEQVLLVWGSRQSIEDATGWQDIFLDQWFAIVAHVQHLVTSI